MNSLILYLFVLYVTSVDSRTYLSSTAPQLRQILRIVSPGDTIQLRDGYYPGYFIANRFGRPNAPIRLVGSKRAIISNNKGTALYLTGQYWWLTGFTLSKSRRGIAIQNGKNNLLERLLVRDMDEEGISIRQDSDDNTIRNCIIMRTGIRLQKYGFGIAIGSDESQSYRGYVDRSDRNLIVNNRFQTSSPAEAIHAYEGTCCGVIRENYFEGRPITNPNNYQLYNRFWVAINGNGYQIVRNSGRYVAIDGFRVRMSDGYDGDGSQRPDYSSQEGSVSRDYNSDDDDIEIQGCGNQFRGNRCEIDSNGYCIRIMNANRCRALVYSDNTVVGNTALTNVPVISNL